MAKRTFVALSLFALINSNPSFAYKGEELLSAFSATCPGQGEWTIKALAQAEALISALNIVAQDSNCKSLAGSVAELGVLSSHITALSTISSNLAQAKAYEAQQNALLTEISNTTDTTYIATLQSYLASSISQSSYYSSLSSESTNYETEALKFSTALTTLTSGSEALMSQLSAQQSCLISQPQILTGVASFIGAVSGGLSLFNPILGLALAGGSTLTAVMVEGARQLNLNKKIKTVGELSTEMEAYRCPLESLANQYCEMVDNNKLIGMKAQFKNSKVPSQLSRGVRLLEVGVPALIDWFTKVRSGVEAQTNADGNRIKDSHSTLSFILGAKSAGMGSFNENQDLFNSENTPEAQWTILKTIFSTVIGGLVEDGSRGKMGPFFDIYSTQLSPYILLGIETKNIPPDSTTGTYKEISKVEKPWEIAGYDADYENIKKRFIDWANKTETLAQNKLDLILRPDPLPVLTSYYDPENSKGKVSAENVINAYLEFTEKYASIEGASVLGSWNPSQGRDPFARLLKETRKSLLKIREVMEMANKGEIEDNVALKKVMEFAKLKVGVGVMKSYLMEPLRHIVLKEVSDLPPEDASIMALFLSAKNIDTVIGQVNGLNNLNELKKDLDNGVTITTGTMKGFIEIFGKNINKTVSLLVKEENISSGLTRDSLKSQRATFCFGLLALNQIPSNFDWENCEGASFKQMLPEGANAPIFSKELTTLPRDQRACIGRDFFRSSQIYQEMNRNEQNGAIEL